MIYQVLNPIMYNMATSLTPLALALGWDDEDEREKIMREMLIQDMLGGVLTGNTTLVPFVSDLPSQVFRLATGEKCIDPIHNFCSGNLRYTKDISGHRFFVGARKSGRC